MDNLNTKKWYQSKTIISSIIAIISTLLPILFNGKLSFHSQQIINENLNQIIYSIITIVSCTVAIIGRLKADKIIK